MLYRVTVSGAGFQPEAGVRVVCTVCTVSAHVTTGATARKLRLSVAADTVAYASQPSCHGTTVAVESKGGGFHMRHYEVMVILDPDLEERAVAP